MIRLHYCRLMLIVTCSFCRISSAQAERIPQINTKIGDRPAVVPQSYDDAVAAEAADPNMHPSLGPYTATAVKSGNWSDPTLWSTGALPGDNATVDLGAHDVTHDISSTIKIKHIHNSHGGTFRRAPGSVLWVSTQILHGKYIEGEPGAPIPGSNPTRTVYWYSDAPGQTVKFGLVSMGGASLRGETKAHFLNAPNNLSAGATTIQLQGVSGANWNVGDEILICATEPGGTNTTDPTYFGPTSFDGTYNGQDGVQTQSQGFRNSQDEPRTIAAINGDIITLNDPLTYSHLVYSTTLPRGQEVTVRPYVANFTRSIQHCAEVASADLQQRPHMMFMHHDEVSVRYVDILNFGRTSTDPSLYVPTGKEVYLGEVNLADANNVRGRYGLHIHGTGAYFGRKMVVVQGVVVRGQSGPSMSAIPVPGWGIVQHNSRCAIEDCITYNVRGAGLVSELGNEIGQWINNISVWNRGDGFKTSWSSRQETHTNHNGHMGVAYENQARGILQQKNVAISSHFGWMFHQQNTNQVARVPDKFSLRFKDPFTQGGKQGFASWAPNAQDNQTYGIEQDQIHDFHDNTCLNVGTGFFVAHRQVTDRGDQSVMFAKRFHCISTSTPFNIANYTFYYSVYDSWWRGNGSGTAAAMGGNTHGMMFVNQRLENYSTGFKDNGLGFNYNGFWIDVDFTNVATPFDNTKTCTSSVESHPFQDLMGPWTVTNPDAPNPGFTARVRTWSSIPSASLPSPYPLAPVGMGGVKPPGAATPSFTLDPNSDTTTGPTGYNTLSFSGTIVDHVGVRKWPEGYVTFNDLYIPQAIGPRKNIDATTGTELVEVNGCFNDNGTWKCRLWFNLDERRDGEYLQFPIDITLVGFDPVFLNANVVDPNATKPDLPLKLESIMESIPAPEPGEGVFIETGGQVVMEAEHAHGVNVNGDSSSWRLSEVAYPGFVGSGYIDTLDAGIAVPEWGNGVEAYYRVRFQTLGVYYVWVRRHASDGASNSAYFGLNGSQQATGNDDSPEHYGHWNWMRLSGTLSVTGAGEQLFQIRRREDGYAIDRIVLTTNSDTMLFSGSEDGPTEIPRGTAFDPTFDLWLAENELIGGDALPNADPDGNGCGNLVEYAFAIPHGSSDRSGLPVATIRDGYLMLQFEKTRSDLIYIPEWTPDLLLPWDTNNIEIGVDGQTTTASISLDGTTSKFIRVRIERLSE